MTSPAAVSAGTPGATGNRQGGRRPAGVVVRALIALTKPRIIELLLVTTVPTMLLAQRGVPSIRLILVTLVGGTLAAGSANTINCYIDRDIDAIMKRTSRRPLVVNGHGTIKPWEALAWGIALGAGATLLLRSTGADHCEKGERQPTNIADHGSPSLPKALQSRRG